MITIDFETRSFCDLKAAGAYKYSLDPTTVPTLLAYKIGAATTRLWAPWSGLLPYFRENKIVDLPPVLAALPDDLADAVARGEKIVAHNSFFERCIWEHVCVPRFGWPTISPRQWVCSMATAQANGLPGSLAMAARVLGLSAQKGTQRAMQRTMSPRPHWRKTGRGDVWFCTEDDYRELGEYCVQDVETEHELYQRLIPLSPREREIWLLDQKINWRGVHVDKKLAEGAWRLFDARRQSGIESLSRITAGEVTTPNQTAKIAQWVTAHGVEMTNCQAGTVADILEQADLAADIRTILETRQSVGGAAELKYRAFLDHLSDDNILRGELVYHGAHTGRWTSKGVQLHNAVKNKMDPDDAERFIRGVRMAADVDSCFDCLNLIDIGPLLTTLVRACLIPAPGMTFIDLDYASIEARVVAWLAREGALLDAFLRGTPVYEQMAAEIFGIPIEQVTKAQRALGKVAVLGLGYGMGIDKFYATCINWGVKIVTPELAERAVTLYRKKFKRIVAYWYDLEKAIRRTIKTGIQRRFGTTLVTHESKTRILTLTLPNGRALHYHKCAIVDGQIQYFGKLLGGGYGTVKSWGGKFTENIDQALSRDYMALAMRRLDAMRNVECVLTVHDELLLQVPSKLIEALLPAIKKNTIPKPVWAAGLPVDIGYWVGLRFRKD